VLDAQAEQGQEAKRPQITPKGGDNAAKPKAETSYVTQKQVSNMIAALLAFKNAKRLKGVRCVIVDLDSNTEANFKSFHNSKLSESKYTQEYHYNIKPS
jgi:hypothetical protein